MFLKLGEAAELTIEPTENCLPEISAEVLANWKKLASNLKVVAPKADDFLYFTAVIIHAAEAAAIHDDGTPKLTREGKPVEVGWDKAGGTWKWTSNDSTIKPYKNSNGDIFPAEELVKAYKKWVHKPLCIDHKSSSVDHVRGFIVDTYFDHKLKRVVALCALDKAGYPQLARQVSTSMSNCVSMGTAVGRAICTEAGCHRVARTEQDFCNHMRHKTGYGEINIDLNPIELSIVNTGADQKATIKQVLAAANAMNAYLETKEQEITKLAGNYSANFSFDQDQTGNTPQITNVSVNSKDLATFKTDILKAIEDFEQVQSSYDQKNDQNGEEKGNDLALVDSITGSTKMDETPATDLGQSYQTPQNARFAEEDLQSSLQKITSAMEMKLDAIQKGLQKLENATKYTQEEQMSNISDKKAYFQGAGGVNEPTPGQAKYPKDPLNEHDRNHEDKQMVGQPPFPEVGDVEGLHPSPSSVDPSDELERKKMLARAESEDRALRRQAIVQMAKEALNKSSYYQGGGGINEPTPGKVKYPKDKLNEEDRNYEDKQMVGQSPFPGVGDVEGLHPSPLSADVKDELKRKEMLQRASLRARFVKAANQDGSQNLGKSAWEVFLGDKLLLTASVDDLTAGKSDMFYDSVATKEFGTKLIEKVKVQGAENVSKLFKKAQMPAPEATSAPVAAPADLAPPADAGLAGAEEAPPADGGAAGDPKKEVLNLAEKAQEVVSDLTEAARALSGEQKEMGGANLDEAAPMDMAASEDDDKFSTASMKQYRKNLNGMLLQSMKESIADLTGLAEELKSLADLEGKAVDSQTFKTVKEEAVVETKNAIADGFKLMNGFVLYADGSKNLIKRAEMESELAALAEGESMENSPKETSEEDLSDANDLMSLIQDETNADLDAVQDLMSDDGEGDEYSEHSDTNDSIQVKTPEEAAMIAKQNPNANVMVQASFNSKQGRAALRAKLASDALDNPDDGELRDMSKEKFSEIMGEADKLSDGRVEFDTKPSDNLGLVETLPEVNKVMLDVAKTQPKVRKQAEAIQELVASGKLDPNDVDALVAEGLDKDAVSYWKKYYGQTEGGSEFASELVKEHVKAQMEAEFNKYRVKIARAYELAYDMAERGMCNSDRGAITLQVDEIMKFDDPSFDSLKRVVSRHQITGMRKSAGTLPLVGVRGVGEVQAAVEEDEWSMLASKLGNKANRF